MKRDVSYKVDGLFTTFIPDTAQGEIAVREMMAQNENSNKVFSVHSSAVIEQLRKAGYVVRKAKPVTRADIDNLFDELDALGL